MDFISIINFLLIAGIIQGFGFNIFTILSKKKYGSVIIYLNLIVLFISLNNLQRWLIENNYSSDLFLIKQMLVPWYILILAMFYEFITHYLRIEKKVNNFTKLTLIIFASEIVIRLCFISYVYYEVPNQDDYLIKKYTTVEDIFNLIYSSFLFINACIFVFSKHEMLTYILSFDDLSWIKHLIIFGSLLMLCWMLAVTIKTTTGNDWAYYPLRLGTSVLLYWIAYQGTFKYNMIEDRIILRNSIKSEGGLQGFNNLNKAQTTNDFYSEKHEKEFESIRKYIITRKLYLNPLLSMEDVANELGISKSHFSKIINSYSDYNFSDFINWLRVEQAKKILLDDEFSEYTIIAIGLECGFNSKSTFYSAFKKFTSITPSLFRNTGM